MRFAVRHETRFDYAVPVRFARCNLRLRPIMWSGQTLISHGLSAQPGGTIGWARADASLANVSRLVVAEAARELTILSEAVVDVDRAVPIPADNDPDVAAVARMARESRDVSAISPANYLFPSPLVPLDPRIADWCAPLLDPGAGVLSTAIALAQYIQQQFTYDAGATTVHTTPMEAFGAKAGVCQDFAHVMISGMRSAGMPAAYVSGYLRTFPPPGEARLIGADATHAWVLVWAGPARGWVGVDPTNGIWMAGDHIVTAIGRDYSEVAPIDGIFLGFGAQSIKVSVDVAPLIDAPSAHN